MLRLPRRRRAPARRGCPSSSRLRSVLRRGQQGPASGRLLRSQQFPTSIGAQTCAICDIPMPLVSSQQFPTSIGAQTCGRRSSTYLAPTSQQFPTSIGAQTRKYRWTRDRCDDGVPAVPDFDRCSDPKNWADRMTSDTVPAVPDFDRCSDRPIPAIPPIMFWSQQFPTSIGAQTSRSLETFARA